MLEVQENYSKFVTGTDLVRDIQARQATTQTQGGAGRAGRADRANFTRLVPGCIEAKFCK